MVVIAQKAQPEDCVGAIMVQNYKKLIVILHKSQNFCLKAPKKM